MIISPVSCLSCLTCSNHLFGFSTRRLRVLTHPHGSPRDRVGCRCGPRSPRSTPRTASCASSSSSSTDGFCSARSRSGAVRSQEIHTGIGHDRRGCVRLTGERVERQFTTLSVPRRSSSSWCHDFYISTPSWVRYCNGLGPGCGSYKSSRRGAGTRTDLSHHSGIFHAQACR